MLISERVDAVLRKQLGDGFEWTAKTSLTDKIEEDGLELDSLDIVELIMGLEDEFKIEIPDDDMVSGGWHLRSTMNSVGDLACYLESRLETKQAMFS